MSRVFVVNEPLKTNRESGEKGRAIDLRPAQKFGELVFLSPAGEPPLDPEGWLPKMREMLVHFGRGDYLLPVGHPALITAAAGIIGAHAAIDRLSGDEYLEELCVLVWQGREVGYAPVRLPLFPSEKNHLKTSHPQSQEKTDGK